MSLFDDSAGSRTEQPTQRRRRQAREQGHVPRSAELLIAARVITLWIVLAWWSAGFVEKAKHWVLQAIHDAGRQPVSTSRAGNVMADLISPFVATVSFPLLLVTALVVLTHFLQVGWLWRWENCLPQLARVSPLHGFRRLVSVSTLGRVLAMFAKLFLVMMVAGAVMQSSSFDRLLPFEMRGETDVTAFAAIAMRVVSSIAVTLVVFGLGDYAYRRWQFEASLRMTREELREELKDIEVHPQIRQQRESAARQLSESVRSSAPRRSKNGPED